jgi:hypothetical protein
VSAKTLGVLSSGEKAKNSQLMEEVVWWAKKIGISIRSFIFRQDHKQLSGVRDVWHAQMTFIKQKLMGREFE